MCRNCQSGRASGNASAALQAPVKMMHIKSIALLLVLAFAGAQASIVDTVASTPELSMLLAAVSQVGRRRERSGRCSLDGSSAAVAPVGVWILACRQPAAAVPAHLLQPLPQDSQDQHLRSVCSMPMFSAVR